MIRGLIGTWDDTPKSYNHKAIYSEWFDIMQTALMPLVCFSMLPARQSHEEEISFHQRVSFENGHVKGDSSKNDAFMLDLLFK